MNRNQLIEALATHFQGNKKQAAQALDAVLETITREVARGEKVAIKGFGAFEKAVRPARMVRNPSTGELIEASAKVVMRFRPSAQLRDVISGAAQLPARTLGVAMAAGGAFMGRDARSSRARSNRNGERSSEPAPASPSPDDDPTPAKKATRTPAKKSTSAKKTPSGTAKKSTSAKKTTSGAGTKKATPAKKATSGTTARKTTSGAAKKSAPAKKTTAKKTTTAAKKTTSGTTDTSSTGSSS